jgi:hypothetical protein
LFVAIAVPWWQLAQSSVSGVPQVYVRTGAAFARFARWQGFVPLPAVPHVPFTVVAQLPL